MVAIAIILFMLLSILMDACIKMMKNNSENRQITLKNSESYNTTFATSE